jgi:hypothetical protein
MSAPEKGIEVDLKEVGCPYAADDPRTPIWLDGYGKGQSDGIDRGAKVVSEVYDRALAAKL